MVDFRAVAAAWVDDFNSHELERILAHYADEVELISPLYLRFSGGTADALNGKTALRDYFGAALAANPQLHFDLLEVAAGTRGYCVRYRSNLGDMTAMECAELDAKGLIRRVVCHYV